MLPFKFKNKVVKNSKYYEKNFEKIGEKLVMSSEANGKKFWNKSVPNFERNFQEIREKLVKNG